MDFSSHKSRFENRLKELEGQLSHSSGTLASKLPELGREYARLRDTLGTFEKWEGVCRQISENAALRLEHATDLPMMEMIDHDLGELRKNLESLECDLKVAIMPPDPHDSRNTILEIRAGTGGDEAALFAGDLYRMYSRYSESMGWKVEPMEMSPSGMGGYKEIVASVQGKDVYRYLRHESGVHRVQRIPSTEANGRIHTSTATVAVLPEAEEVDVEIRPDELEITVCRASGPGGQGVNTTDSAVQITHKPSGLIVRCSDERSQLKNKAKALRVLRSRLLTRRQEEEEAKYAKERKSQIGTGDRSERIRTYNFPQNRVTDHRYNITLYNLSEVIEGRVGNLLAEVMGKYFEQRLAEQEK